jgi:Group II intron, maturase-specific domain
MPCGRSRRSWLSWARAQPGQDPDRAPTTRKRGLDFLGVRHRHVRMKGPRRHIHFLPRWPSREGQQALALTRGYATRATGSVNSRSASGSVTRSKLWGHQPVLRPWSGYFRYRHSARHFDRISKYACKRLALFVANRHQRKGGLRPLGLRLLVVESPPLIGINGTHLSPRANKPWRVKPNAGGERRR